jgi:NADPH:quinone reductase
MRAMQTLPQTMTAVVPGEDAGARVVRLVQLPVPKPQAGEVLIKVAGAGVNRGDLAQVAGMYPPPPGAPQTLGLEVSGTVVSTGTNVERWDLGDEVCALVAGGGYAEYCIAHEGSVLPKPSRVSLVDAAALPEVYMTVWTNVVDRARLKEGETLLVHGGSSGIGTAAIQLFAARGHRVFTTAGSAEKCKACTEPDGAGVDVILDMVGGDYIAKNVGLLKLEGRLVNIAFQQGSQANLNLMLVMLKRLTITGSTLRARANAEKAAIAAAVEREVWPLLVNGRIKPVVDSVMPLHKAAEAHERMAGSSHIGKILLTP